MPPAPTPQPSAVPRRRWKIYASRATRTRTVPLICAHQPAVDAGYTLALLWAWRPAGAYAIDADRAAILGAPVLAARRDAPRWPEDDRCRRHLVRDGGFGEVAPSGLPAAAGKTTLLRLIAGFDAPTEGRASGSTAARSVPGRVLVPLARARPAFQDATHLRPRRRRQRRPSRSSVAAGAERENRASEGWSRCIRRRAAATSPALSGGEARSGSPGARAGLRGAPVAARSNRSATSTAHAPTRCAPEGKAGRRGWSGHHARCRRRGGTGCQQALPGARRPHRRRFRPPADLAPVAVATGAQFLQAPAADAPRPPLHRTRK